MLRGLCWLAQPFLSGRGSSLKKNRNIILVFTVGIICIVAAGVVYALDSGTSDEAIEWDVTLVSTDGTEKVVDFNEIKEMPSVSGQGGFFTSVGVINGPFDIKGVPVIDICDLVGGVARDEIVYLYAVDGYSAVFDYDQVRGGLDTFDPETMKLVSHGDLEVILAYQQNGKPLSREYGKPLRLAVIGKENLLTEGHHWVKWINRIEIVKLD